MAKSKWEVMQEVVRKTPTDILLKVVGSINGHSVYDPKQFLEIGLDAGVVKHFTRTYTSDGTVKGSLFDGSGYITPSLSGVSGLSLMEFLADCFGISTWKIGRGSGCQHLAEQLIEKLTKEEGA